jgi:hypothetical protein
MLKIKDDRPQIKMLRILRLIDRMAGLSLPKTVYELFGMMSDEYGCTRTLHRDIELLETMGIIHHVGDRRIGKFGRSSHLYQINLVRSERLQRVAMHVVDGGEA